MASVRTSHIVTVNTLLTERYCVAIVFCRCFPLFFLTHIIVLTPPMIFPLPSLLCSITVENSDSFLHELFLFGNKFYMLFLYFVNLHMFLYVGSHEGTGFTPLKWTVEKEQRIFYLCVCKQTKSPPICDGSHTNAPLPVKERQENCARKEGHVTDCKLCTKCGWVPDF